MKLLTKLAESDGADWPSAELRMRNKLDPSFRDAPRPERIEKQQNYYLVFHFEVTQSYSRAIPAYKKIIYPKTRHRNCGRSVIPFEWTLPYYSYLWLAAY